MIYSTRKRGLPLTKNRQEIKNNEWIIKNARCAGKRQNIFWMKETVTANMPDARNVDYMPLRPGATGIAVQTKNTHGNAGVILFPSSRQSCG